MNLIPLPLLMADYFLSAHYDTHGSDPYREEITILDGPASDPTMWIASIPRDPDKLKKTFIALEPAFILMQAIGFRVGDIYVSERGVNGQRTLRFDRAQMTVACDAGDWGEPLPHFDGDTLVGLPDGQDLDLSDLGGQSAAHLTISITFALGGPPGTAALWMTEMAGKNLQFHDGVGYVFLYPLQETDFGVVLSHISEAMGNGSLEAPNGSIRWQLIEGIMAAVPPAVNENGLEQPDDYPLDEMALWPLGLIYEPRGWIFPSLWLEDVEEMQERVKRTHHVGTGVWSYITATRADLRRFLEYETVGFGGTMGRLRPEEITLEALLERIDTGESLAGTGMVMVREEPLRPRRAIRRILKSVNSRRRFARKLDTPTTLKRLKFSDIKFATYTEFLTYLYRQGALDFQGLTGQSGPGLRLPSVPDDRQTYDTRRDALQTGGVDNPVPRRPSTQTKALIGANALSSADMQHLQVEMMAVWENYLLNPIFAHQRLTIVRDALAPYSDPDTSDALLVGMDRWLAPSSAAEIVARCGEAVAVLDKFLDIWANQIANDVYWGDQSLPLGLTQADLLFCLQFAGVATAALDPVFVVANSWEYWQAPGSLLNGFMLNTQAFNTGLDLDKNDTSLSADLRKLAKHHEAMMGGMTMPFASVAVQAGIVQGGTKHIIKMCNDLYIFASDPQGAIDRLIKDLVALFDIPGEILFDALGKAMRDGLGKMIDALMAEKVWYVYAFRLGQLLGPLVAEVIMELLCEAYIVAPLLRTGGMALRAAITGTTEVLDQFVDTARFLNRADNLLADDLLGFADDVDDFLDAIPLDTDALRTPFIRNAIDPDTLTEANFVTEIFEAGARLDVDTAFPSGSTARTEFFEQLRDAIARDPATVVAALRTI